MAQIGRSLVDGEGADRVAMRLIGSPLRLRPAREDDCRLLWEWANDPETRKASFSSEEILWNDHAAWYAKKLSEKTTMILLGVDLIIPASRSRSA